MGNADELTVTVGTDTAGRVRLHPVGALDYAGAPHLRQAVEELGFVAGQEWVIDLSRVDFCDSMGVNVLILARHHSDAAAARLVLAGAPERIRQLLGLLGLEEYFVFESIPGSSDEPIDPITPSTPTDPVGPEDAPT